MGTIHRFIANPSEPSEVMAWFRALDVPCIEVAGKGGFALHFPSIGSLVLCPDGAVDTKTSPVVSVFLPQVRRGTLWTVGEVHFLSTPLRQRFPRLHHINTAFAKWLASHQCIYSNKSHANEYNYYLEGSAQCYDAPIYAFETAMLALSNGQYFVSEGDNEHVLERVCRSLRLRGVECSGA